MEYRKQLIRIFYNLSCALVCAFVLELLLSVIHTARDEGILEDIERFIFPNQIIDDRLNAFKSSTSNRKCTVSKCINLQLCVLHPTNHLTIALQPLLFKNEESVVTKEFLALRRIIRESRYFVSNASLACLLLPGIDTFQKLSVEPTNVSNFLELARKESAVSSNLVTFNFLGQESLKSFFDPSISVSAQFRRTNYRPNYDISVPLHRPYNIWNENNQTVESLFNMHSLLSTNTVSYNDEELHIGVFAFSSSSSFTQSELNMFQSFKKHQQIVTSGHKLNVTFFFPCHEIMHPDIFPVCDELGIQHSYKSVVTSFDIIIIFDEVPMFEAVLMDVLQGGRSIPSIISNDYVAPFSEVLEWNLFSFYFLNEFIPELPKIFAEVPVAKLEKMRSIANKIYSNYFSSLQQVVLTTFEILEARLVSGAKIRHTNDWNLLIEEKQMNFCPFVENHMEFTIGQENTDVNVIILFRQPIENIVTGEERGTFIINTLLNTAEGFDVKTLTVIWHSIDYKHSEHPTFNGVRRTFHPLEIFLFDVEFDKSILNFWVSEHFTGHMDNGQNGSNEGFLIINGDLFENVTNVFKQGAMNLGFQLWRERVLSTIVFGDGHSISSELFPDFGLAAIYDFDVLKGIAKNIIEHRSGKFGDDLKTVFKNCHSVSLSKFSLEHSFRQPSYRFQLCQC